MQKSICVTCALLSLVMIACQKPMHVSHASTSAVAINASMDAIEDSSYLRELEPITRALNAELDVVIGHAPQTLDIYQPECPMLNWASDALLVEAQKYYPGTVDFSVVNIGGMRSPWQAGDITLRHIYELMPFDNELVVLTLAGEDVIELCQIFAEDDGQGVSGLRMISEDKQLADVTIQGEPVEPQRLYHVATSDYLAGGTDHMTPLTRATQTWRSDRLIRDLYIEYVRTTGTVAAQVDGRMDCH